MTKAKSVKIRTKVRAGAISTTPGDENPGAIGTSPGGKNPGQIGMNHNARPAKKLDAKLVKLVAKRVRGTKTGVRAGMTAKWV